MKWSYSIARIADIDVRLHVTFLLLLGWWGYIGYQNGGTAEAERSVFFIMLLFLCVLMHEFGHAIAARRYGIHTPNITLYPIGGVARLERMPENPVQELVIAIAGPMVNVVIVAVLWLALGMPHTFHTYSTDTVKLLSTELMRVNGYLILFNLIPAFPMDGGRVLRALLAMRMTHVNATKAAARIGQGIAVVLALIGLFGVPSEMRSLPVVGLYADMFGTDSNPFLLLIAMFVFAGARQEATYAGIRETVSGMNVGDAMVTQFHVLAADMPVAQAASEAQRDVQPVYPVTNAHMHPVGLVLRNALLQATTGTVADLAQPVPSVAAGASFGDAFQLMQQSGSPVLPVINPGGQLVGLVSLNLLTERARKSRS
jgi:Zn-dependent protease/CBS domain-containing protein